MTLSPAWRGRIIFAAAAAAMLLVVPSVLGDFRLNLLAKYLCYAIVAVGVGLAWGRGGMLVLGQGVFFGLGGYAMAMHLKLAETPAGQVPDLFTLYGNGTLPLWWEPFRHAWFALPMVVLGPMLVAYALGSLIFRRRVRGAFFAILSQALAAALAILIIGQQGQTGGTNGITVRSFFGYDLGDPVNQRTVYVLVVLTLFAVFAAAWQIYRSRLGSLLLATRDAENRVRFLGYDPTRVKLVAYVGAAGAAGLAGALFVPVVGSISPASIGVVPSIEFVVGVALGGRATLLGPVLGAVLYGVARSELSTWNADRWTYIQGALFILVVAFLPDGFASLKGKVTEWLAARKDPGGPGIPSARRPGEPSTSDPAVMTGATS